MRKGSGELGRKPEHETLFFPCFFRVKWLQPAMKGTSSVRRLRLRSLHARIVPPMCFATSGCSCVRSSMRFLKLWWQIALEWLHDVASALCWGGSRSTKPCVFPCKVAAAGEELFLLCVLQRGCVCVRSWLGARRRPRHETVFLLVHCTGATARAHFFLFFCVSPK